MTDMFPELKGLCGGKKQAWINRNMDVIVALADKLEFEKVAAFFKMKPGTLSRALMKAEGQHRPVITKADKAISKAAMAEVRSYEAVKKLNEYASALNEIVEHDDRRWNYLTNLFIAQSRMLEMAAQFMLNDETGSNRRNFTEHISCAPRHKVGLSTRGRRGQLFSCHGPGREKLPGPVKGIRSHHRKGIHKRGFRDG